MFVTKKLKKSVGIKPRELALIWYPSPVEVTQVRSSMSDAVLTFLNGSTGGAIVQRSHLVMDPSAIGEVTRCFVNFFHFYKKDTHGSKTLISSKTENPSLQNK